MKKTVVALLAAASVALVGCSSTDAPDAAAPAADPGHYAAVNGLNMYYEVHGEDNGQPPLVLLHGGLSATGTSFGELLPTLAQSRKVISVEQQAHGHTADIDRVMSIESMATDTMTLLDQLGIPQADIFGYSNGAGVALNIAIRNPELVHKLVLASGSYSTAGLYPGMLEGIAQMQPEMFEGTPFLDEYRSIAPRPEDFGRLLERTKEIDSTIPEYSPEQVRAVTAPTLLIAADSDIIRPEHTVEFFRLLGGGRNGDIEGMPESQLLVVPGASHVTVVQQPAVVLPAIDLFLDADPAAQ